jgi:RNA polymerase sigma-70 factor (ECF subfamily)
MPTATESDEELLASLEPGSFAVLYRRHVEDLVAFFMRRNRNAELAADLTAETFAAALVARARFDPGRGSASAWLFGIALHKVARVERREAVRQHVLEDRAYGEIAVDAGTSEAVVRKRVSRGLAAVRQRMGPRA